jgi:hypothetical protein
MFPQLTSGQQARVAQEILQFVSNGAARKQAAHESAAAATAERSA